MLERHADEVIDDGRRGLVRNGYLPEREIMTGIGPVAVRCRRMRDRVGEGSERIRFSLPYARRSKSLEVPIPILYLKGTSTGEFEEAQVALGPKSACAGASVISGHHPGHARGQKGTCRTYRWHNERHRKRIRNDPPSHRAFQGAPL